MHYRNFTLAPLAALLTLLSPFSSPAQSTIATPPSARIFRAAPGTNTLQIARDAVRAWRAEGHADEAATILLSAGEYALTELLTLNDRDGAVTWRTQSAEKTLITGGQRITGFTADSAGLWHARTSRTFEQLYVHGRRATRARWPMEGFLNMESVQQEELPDGKARLTVKLAASEAAALPSDPAAFRGAQILVFHNWDTSRYPVSSVDAAAGTVTVAGGRMKSWNPWNAKSRFFFDNSALIQPLAPGTWFLDQQGNLSYRPLPGEQIGQTDFVAPAMEKFLEIRGANHLHFAGLRFHHTEYKMPAGGCPPMQAAAAIGAAIQVDEARDVTFAQCEIAHTGNYGIWFRQGCQDCRIEHCRLADLGAGAIRIGEMAIPGAPASSTARLKAGTPVSDPARLQSQTGRIIADNNIIRGYGRIHPSAVGVWIGQSANNRITHNDVSDAFYTAISVGWTWGYGRSLATNNFIGCNRLHQIGQGVLSDMGGIYTLGVSPGSACVGNVIYDVRAHDYGGWGIYPDEGSTGWRIESNLVWRCTCVNAPRGGAFHQHYGATNLLANNLFAFSSGPPMQATRVEDHLSFTLERNLIISSNTPFFTGPWDKIQFASRSNCFVACGATGHLFPSGDLAAWQQAGHDPGSILTNLEFLGRWPDVTLPRHSPAFAIGFQPFDPTAAGVYGERRWKKLAAQAPE